MKKVKSNFYLCLFLILTFLLTGCALVVQKGRQSDLEKIQSLEDELSELSSAKGLLQQRLSQEIQDKQVQLDMQQRGLVITVLAEVLFDSGKAKLREESYGILNKVSEIFKTDLKEHRIGIEGHTDNIPIQHSGWNSNWELSAHRALSVLHYLVDQGVNPNRLSAIGYGEFKPVTSNATEQGRQLNRRVEIVILPSRVDKLDIEDKVKSGEDVEIEILK